MQSEAVLGMTGEGMVLVALAVLVTPLDIGVADTLGTPIQTASSMRV